MASLCQMLFQHLIRMELLSLFHPDISLHFLQSKYSLFLFFYLCASRGEMCLQRSLQLSFAPPSVRATVSLLYRNPTDFVTICKIVKWQTSYTREMDQTLTNSLRDSSLGLEPVSSFKIWIRDCEETKESFQVHLIFIIEVGKVIFSPLFWSGETV